jgi:hypothetical protein
MVTRLTLKSTRCLACEQKKSLTNLDVNRLLITKLSFALAAALILVFCSPWFFGGRLGQATATQTASAGNRFSTTCSARAALYVAEIALTKVTSLTQVSNERYEGMAPTGKVTVRWNCGVEPEPYDVQLDWSDTSQPIQLKFRKRPIASVAFRRRVTDYAGLIADSAGRRSLVSTSEPPRLIFSGDSRQIGLGYSSSDRVEAAETTTSIISGNRGPVLFHQGEDDKWPEGRLVVAQDLAPQVRIGPLTLRMSVFEMHRVLGTGKVEPYCFGSSSTLCVSSERYSGANGTLEILEAKHSDELGVETSVVVGMVLRCPLSKSNSAGARGVTEFGGWKINGKPLAELQDGIPTWAVLNSGVGFKRLSDGFWTAEVTYNGSIMQLYIGP